MRHALQGAPPIPHLMGSTGMGSSRVPPAPLLLGFFFFFHACLDFTTQQFDYGSEIK